MFRNIIVLIATVLIVSGVAMGAGQWGKTGGNPKLEKKVDATRGVLLNPAERETYITGQTIDKGKIGYLNSDGKMWLANYSTAAKTNGYLGISHSNYSTGRAGTFTTYGLYSSATPFGSFSSIGNVAYLRAAGNTTTIKPALTGTTTRVLGWFKSRNKIMFRPSGGSVTN